ncbi:deoxyribonuclease IV [Desulfogranum japonicum]|uniref:deoxyribonuclease IV n=1 Tax=Desulfogranum japonicum TaxID=231447 RepID=UPI000417F30E|nr:deoxyribonuclease IV [Desulfogranum japonicum]
MPLLGAHESVAGGLHNAFERIEQVGGESLQIFTRNQRQWKAAPLRQEEIDLFRESWGKTGTLPVASHASYLINLGSSDKKRAGQSVQALVAEVERCQQLGIPFLVLHPGSHGGKGVEAGLQAVVKNLDTVFEQTLGKKSGQVRILLETTAGQGTGLGSRFEELGWIRANSSYAERLGVCVDTCHIFAAGYDIRTPEAYRATMAALEEQVGLQHVHFFHLNDSKKELGSKVDRHEHIGKGCIGKQGFAHLLNDPQFVSHPMTLETPKGDDLAEDRENLRVLRLLMGHEE